MTSIVRDDPLYDTSMHTFLTLYQSALGNVDFDINIESDSPFTYLAIVSILIFSGFGYVLIHGFVIARITVGAFNFNYRNVYMYVCIYVELRWDGWEHFDGQVLEALVSFQSIVTIIFNMNLTLIVERCMYDDGF